VPLLFLIFVCATRLHLPPFVAVSILLPNPSLRCGPSLLLAWVFHLPFGSSPFPVFCLGYAWVRETSESSYQCSTFFGHLPAAPLSIFRFVDVLCGIPASFGANKVMCKFDRFSAALFSPPFHCPQVDRFLSAFFFLLSSCFQPCPEADPTLPS